MYKVNSIYSVPCFNYGYTFNVFPRFALIYWQWRTECGCHVTSVYHVTRFRNNRNDILRINALIKWLRNLQRYYILYKTSAEFTYLVGEATKRGGWVRYRNSENYIHASMHHDV